MKKIREYEPCPMRWVKHRSSLNTICNDLRDIYFEAEKMGNEKIMNLARIAISKGKSMDKKLKEYNKHFARELFSEEKNE